MRKPLIVIAGAVLFVGIALTWPRERAMGQAPAAQSGQWEYAVLSSSGIESPPFMWTRGDQRKNETQDPVADRVATTVLGRDSFFTLLDEAGKEGWELTSVLENSRFYFKRPAR